MITMPHNINSVVSANTLRVGQPRQYAAGAQEQAVSAGEKFDKVTLSAREGEDPKKLELRTKLSQEVRTATTTGTLASLREQVQAGTYQVDAASIAKRLLLLGEV